MDKATSHVWAAPARSSGTQIQFFLLCVLWTFISSKPEWTIPGLIFIGPGQTLIQIFLLISWVFHADKKLRNPVTKYFFLFLVLMAVSLFLARNRGLGMDVLRGMSFFYITYLSTITFANTQKRIFGIINIFLFGNFWIAVLGILGQGSVRGASIFDDQNDLALQINMVLPIVIFLAVKEKRLFKRLFYLTSGVIYFAVNIIGFSRGGFVGLVAVLVFVLLKLPIRKLKAIIMILIIVGGVLCFAPESYWNEIGTLREGTRDTTAGARIYYWKLATRMFIDHPIIGVGVSNFGMWLQDYVRDDDRLSDGSKISGTTNRWGRVCHSLYFTVLAETGAIGFVLFTLMVYWAFKEIRLGRERLDRIKLCEDAEDRESEEEQPFAVRCEKVSDLGLGIMGGLIGVLVSGAFLSVLYYPQFWLLCSLSTAMGNLMKGIVDEKSGRTQ